MGFNCILPGTAAGSHRMGAGRQAGRWGIPTGATVDYLVESQTDSLLEPENPENRHPHGASTNCCIVLLTTTIPAPCVIGPKMCAQVQMLGSYSALPALTSAA